MGVGKPDDIVGAVERGVDMFDCVLPTRSGRTGQAFTRSGPINLRNARFAEDQGPLDPACACPVCATWERAYVHHLVRAGEILGAMLMTEHNLFFYQALMADLRAAIAGGTLPAGVAVDPGKGHVLAQPNQLVDFEEVHGEDILRVLTAASNAYQYVLVDCGGRIDEATLTATSVADTIILVTTPEVVAVRNAWRRIQMPEKLGVEKSNVRPSLSHNCRCRRADAYGPSGSWRGG